MKRGLGWLVAVGLGGALFAGCMEQPQNQSGRFNEPIKQKYQSPAASESSVGTGGSGLANGVYVERNLGEGTGDERQTRSVEEQGPYSISRPQPLPRERGTAPLGVGAGRDSSGQAAREQLKD